MIRGRYPLMTALTGAALLLTACADVTAGQGTRAGAPPAAASSGASTRSSAVSVHDGPTLAALLSKGLTQTSSLHLDLSVDVLGQQITATGDESISGGKLTAVDLTETVPTIGELRIVVVGSAVYAKLPAALQGPTTTGKPWIMADANSSNPIARTLGASAGAILSQSSIGSYSELAQAATTVTDKGPDTIDGQPTTHYSLVVDVTKLTSANSALQQLSAAGITSLPADIWVDGKNRLVRLTESVDVSGHATTTTINLSKFDQPVAITAPPADQVSR
jgi:hypothetical protein